MDLSRYGTGVLGSTIAEFASSFYFVFCSCVATTLWPNHTESSVLFIAVLSGLILAVVCECSLEITKACANPVVTIALYLTQRLDRLRFVFFIPAQILGGVTGAAFYRLVTPKSSRDETNNKSEIFENDIELIQGFVIEFLLAVLFIFALFHVLFSRCAECCGRNDGSSWKIGSVYTLCVLIDFPYTGGGLNPSFLLGQAILRNHWANYDRVDHWVYWTAPILGGALGGILYEVWKSAGELNDIERYSHFKRMVALLFVLVLVITFAIVVTVAL
ncbi:lens fiber major intrinsic protein-like isoform X1 [Dendronephthya gigantea]|uniref:lens fiber major intrinsic protein-like isoform X1 n=1 Tax=Dendronephthya gigantea TaxID=151771 RepID=UPI00106B6B9F|nr:lens fiber major intrinsic protein-like isoform X1 [Dendronephthya gigantea]